MKKTLLYVIIPVLLILAVVFTYFFAQYPKKSFSELLGTDQANITKVTLINCDAGMTVETYNKDKIKELINLLSERSYRKEFIPYWGITHYICYLYSDTKEVIRISILEPNIEINNIYYNVKKEIDTDLLKKWFNSLPAKPIKK